MSENPVAIIRPYEPTDCPAVLRLWEACGLVRPWNDPQKDIALKLAFQPGTLRVAERAGAVVGSVMVGYEGHRGWINYLAVDPKCQRLGIGRSLMEHAQAMLHQLNCPKINLQVRRGNDAALAFYEKIGFTEDAVVSMGKRLDGVTRPPV